MNKQTIQVTKFLACEDVKITAVAVFKSKVYVAGYGDKLIVYSCTSKLLEGGSIQFLDDELQSADKAKVFDNYFGCKSSAEEMIVDPLHEILLCRTRKGVYVGKGKWYLTVVRWYE